MYVQSQTEAEDKLDNLVKRDGMRFRLNDMLVQYSLNNVDGEAELIDISTSGCAVYAGAIFIAVDDVVELSFSFDQQEKPPVVFEMQAQVVRIVGETFAVKFLALSDERKEQLYQQLVREVSRSALVL
ncbi:MAG: PilZ domain-containing protein [Desulfobulbus sp.]|nr:PilZ domain-containing protein [Desulfobulbus sp.]